MTTEITSIVAPHDIELEQKLLGSILINNEIYIETEQFLFPDYFSEPIHKKIYETIKTLIGGGKIATPITVAVCFPDDWDIGGMPFKQYLARLAAESCESGKSWFNIEVAKRIGILYALRSIILMGESLAITWRAIGEGPKEIANNSNSLGRELLGIVQILLGNNQTVEQSPAALPRGWAFLLGNLWSRVESPIELALAMEIAHLAPNLAIMDSSTPKEFWPIGQLICVPQFTSAEWKFRFDFAFFDHTPERTLSLIVECDGHDFHERTKEQAASDKSRDRLLTAARIPVFRFTGSEIMNEPKQCALQVYNFISSNSQKTPPEP